jgi:hypothetical protein
MTDPWKEAADAWEKAAAAWKDADDSWKRTAEAWRNVPNGLIDGFAIGVCIAMGLVGIACVIFIIASIA